MFNFENELFHINEKDSGTGSDDDEDFEDNEDVKYIDYPFGIYMIKVALTPDKEFIGIVEVKVNRDFLSHKQKIGVKGFINVDDYYKEEDSEA